MSAMKALLFLALCLAPFAFADDSLDIENAVVGKELSGRKLMRSLMGGDEWGPPPQKGKPPPKGWKPPPPQPKYKTCYITSTYTESTATTTPYTKKSYSKATSTWIQTWPKTYTTYEYKTNEKVYKVPSVYTYYKTSTSYETSYSTIPKEYKKKGWGDDYYIPPGCTPPPED